MRDLAGVIITTHLSDTSRSIQVIIGARPALRVAPPITLSLTGRGPIGADALQALGVTHCFRRALMMKNSLHLQWAARGVLPACETCRPGRASSTLDASPSPEVANKQTTQEEVSLYLDCVRPWRDSPPRVSAFLRVGAPAARSDRRPSRTVVAAV